MLGFVDVILRVPPIFLIDEILKMSMGLSFGTTDDQLVNATISTMSSASTDGAINMGDDIVLLNSSGYNSSSISYNNVSGLGPLLQNATEALFTQSAAAVVDDSDFYTFLSITSLKFMGSVMGKCCFASYLFL